MDLQKDAYPKKVLNRLYKYTDLQKPFHLNMLALVDGLQPRVLSLAEALSYFIAHRQEVVARRVKYDLDKAKERAHILEGLHKCLANIDEVIRIIKSSESRDDAQNNLMKRFVLTEIQANAILETKLAALAKLERAKIEEELKQLKTKIKDLTEILASPNKIKEVVRGEIEEAKKGFGDARRRKVFRTFVYEIPEGTRVARGRGLLNFLEITPQDKILSLITLDKEDEKTGVKDLVMVTQNGIIKRTALEEFKNVRKSGLIAINLRQGDFLKKVAKSSGDNDIIIATKNGQSIKFKEKEIREMGRATSGIRAISLKKGDMVVGMDIIRVSNNQLPITNKKEKTDLYLLVVTENGYGKRTDLKEYRIQGRGGSGIKTAKTTSKTGALVFSKIVGGDEDEDLIVISKHGQVIRTKVALIPKISRATQGVRIMRLEEGDKVASAACI